LLVLFPKYNQDDLAKRMRWPGHVAGMDRRGIWDIRGKPERKGPLGRPRRRWVDNINIVLSEDAVVLTGLIWLRIGTS
jgi:hypothetical protein